jgi:hypothetical protein
VNRRYKLLLGVGLGVGTVIGTYFATRPDDPFRVRNAAGREPRYFEVGALPVT